MAAVTHDQHGPQRRDEPAEERRQAALTAFLGAGMPAPPSTALVVQALAGARRAVAVHLQRGLAIDQWLAGEIRLRGIRENAAILAVMETPGQREEAARAYRQQHPDRTCVLNGLLAVLDHTLPIRMSPAAALHQASGPRSTVRYQHFLGICRTSGCQSKIKIVAPDVSASRRPLTVNERGPAGIVVFGHSGARRRTRRPGKQMTIRQWPRAVVRKGETLISKNYVGLSDRNSDADGCVRSLGS
jgi:hypothetical protein